MKKLAGYLSDKSRWLNDIQIQLYRLVVENSDLNNLLANLQIDLERVEYDSEDLCTELAAQQT